MTAHRYNLAGGKLCLDFANTLENRLDPATVEQITSFVELISFLRQAGGISPAEARDLLALADERPDEAARVVVRARQLREAIYDVFSAVAAGREPKGADLESLSDETAALSVSRRLRRIGGAYRWCCDPAPGDLAWPLNAIVTSAVELLTDGDLERVHDCEADDCAWLFYDASKNHSRRWCDMSNCGNRAKARTFYQRKRKATRRASSEA